MAKTDKVIVTNGAALRAKYGARTKKITDALARLERADAKRGFATRVIYLDRASVSRLGAKRVTDASDPKQNKDAIDAIYRKLKPDYLMILGAIDVIPHVPLRNPIYSPGIDDDLTADGDIPYACDKPYGTDPRSFIGPTRVVGRLPDLTGARDPAYLLSLLQTAAKWKSRPLSAYRDYLGISAEVWRASTELSLRMIFGDGSDLQTCPTKGPRWGAALKRRAHFINCHGAEVDPQFYGQRGERYPVAHKSALIDGKVAEGTIVAAECCYGAQLYDPSIAGTAGISNTYLESGAYAFFGSSTIAYGPSEGNGNADLICQYFIKHVLAGASVGRAALEARQDFVRNVTFVDPADLKTIAQFNLLGDPSVVPVTVAGKGGPARSPKAAPRTAATDRALRRANLTANGAALLESTSVVGKAKRKAAPVPARVRALAGKVASQKVLSFAIDAPSVAKRAKYAGAGAPATLHVIAGRKKNSAPGPQIVAVLAREEAGEIVGVRTIYSR